MRFTARKLTLFRVLTVLAMLCLPMPSYAQNQPAVERVQLPNWDLSDKLELLRDFYPELRFFYDESESCWVAEGTPSSLDRLAGEGIGPGSPSTQNELAALLATLRELPKVELLAIHYRQLPRDEHKWFLRYWNDYPVVRSCILSGKDKERALNAVTEDIAGGNGSAMCFNPRHVLVGTRGRASYSITICFECEKVVAEYPGKTIGLPIGRRSATVLDDFLLHRKDTR